MSQDQILTEEQAHEALLGEYSDAYKSVNGFRPRGWDLHMLCNMDLYDMVQELYEQAQADEDRLVADRAEEAEVLANGIGPTLMGPLAAALKEAL